jgi:hypothetical protein
MKPSPLTLTSPFEAREPRDVERPRSREDEGPAAVADGHEGRAHDTSKDEKAPKRETFERSLRHVLDEQAQAALPLVIPLHPAPVVVEKKAHAHAATQDHTDDAVALRVSSSKARPLPVAAKGEHATAGHAVAHDAHAHDKRPRDREHESDDGKQPAPASTTAPTPSSSPSSPSSSTFVAVEAPRAAEQPMQRLAAALGDDVRGALQAQVSRLIVDVGADAPIQLIVRTRDNIADVRVAGPVGVVEAMTADGVRAALAGEGLSLGSFESSGHTPNDERPDDGAAAASSRRGHASAAPTSSSSASSASTGSTIDGRTSVRV